MTFADLVRHEPRLGVLAADIAATPPVADPDLLWYGRGGWKAELSRLAEWFREGTGPAALATSAAYMVAYESLHALAEGRALPIEIYRLFDPNRLYEGVCADDD